MSALPPTRGAGPRQLSLGRRRCSGPHLVAAGQARVVQPGDPLAGLTPVEFEEFRLGLDDFLEVETAEEGLGPAFNGASCAVCHNVPAVGGISAVSEVRAALRQPDGSFVALAARRRVAVPPVLDPRSCLPADDPVEANVIIRRVPIPVFGAGLVEAIDDDTLLALAADQGRGRDGVSGRAAIVEDRGTGARRVGRFGWKAQHATLLAFAADAYRNEMGITNDLFPGELAVGVDATRMRICDPIPDPEDVADPRTRRRGIDNFASFMRFLAPLERGGGDGAAGEDVFAATGCATCHVPSLTTGANANPLLHRRRCRSSPTCCSTTSAPATASARPTAPPRRCAPRRCGGCGSAARCCTMVRPRPSTRRSGGTAARPRRRAGPTNAWPTRRGRR